MKPSCPAESSPSSVIASDRACLRRAFDLCVQKTRGNIKRLADEPKAAPWAVDGNFFTRPDGFYHIDNWTSSFFTGMALLAWEETEDEFFLEQVLRLAPHYREKVFTRHLDTMHDLGFLYTLYSVALHKLTGDATHREVGLRAAEVLALRFHPKGKFIRAWGRRDTDAFENMAIIDCLMNLPLLFWAAGETGHPGFAGIARAHADTVLRNFLRPDDALYHAYRYDLPTGQPLAPDNYGGCEIESDWARGTAWAIYGFALIHGYTREASYLEAATRLARKFIAHLDEEVIPVWEFKPRANTPRIRDASAASIAVCALQELLKHTNDAPLAAAKRRLLVRLCSEDYLDFHVTCPGVQRNGQVGDGTKGGAQNVYTSWGDYFLMEALSRELQVIEAGWW
jgi:unsaturated chondroitin disaccharide hydrolase